MMNLKRKAKPQTDDEVTKLFDMVYQWGRVGVIVDKSAPAFQEQLKKIKAQRV